MGQLDGKVAIVTGAARGQGRSHALALAAEGARVVACDIAAQIESVEFPMSTPDELQETVRMITASGGDALAVTTDIRSTEQVQALTDRAVEDYGSVDILVANAAICGTGPLEQLTDAQWDDMIDVNLTGTFKCLRAVLPHMKRTGYGRVVVTSSMTGRHGNANLSHYSASKFGVIGMVKSAALEVATMGITVNAMCPTSANTPMLHNDTNYRLFCPDVDNPTIDDVRPRFASLNPMELPWLEPEAYTRAVMFLVTDPGHISGATLEVGAGVSAQLA
ncbi:MAG: putative short-chain dehydrogenase/reductase [Acidimicrobiales bacterium]|nr:MAG: putative short-chain dehydrogenase/reductase [Acidimicrobiales bacterium]